MNPLNYARRRPWFDRSHSIKTTICYEIGKFLTSYYAYTNSYFLMVNDQHALQLKNIVLSYFCFIY